jgi:hypothetical protein
MNIIIIAEGVMIQQIIESTTAFPKLVGREPICGRSRKVFEMFNYIKIKNHKKWESGKTKHN